MTCPEKRSGGLRWAWLGRELCGGGVSDVEKSVGPEQREQGLDGRLRSWETIL